MLPSNCETEGLFRSHDVIFILLGKWDQEMAGGWGGEGEEGTKRSQGGWLFHSSLQ